MYPFLGCQQSILVHHADAPFEGMVSSPVLQAARPSASLDPDWNSEPAAVPRRNNLAGYFLSERQGSLPAASGSSVAKADESQTTEATGHRGGYSMDYRKVDNWQENFWSGRWDRQKSAAGS